MFVNVNAAIGLVDSRTPLDKNNVYWIWPEEEQADLREAVLALASYLGFDKSYLSSKIAMLVSVAGDMIYNNSVQLSPLILKYWNAEVAYGHGSPMLNMAKEAMIREVSKDVKSEEGQVYVFRDPSAEYDNPFKYIVMNSVIIDSGASTAGQHVSAVFAKELIDSGIAVFDQSKSGLRIYPYSDLLKLMYPEQYAATEGIPETYFIDNSAGGIPGLGLLDLVTAFRPSIRPVTRKEYQDYLEWARARTQKMWNLRSQIRRAAGKDLRSRSPLNDPPAYFRVSRTTNPKRNLVRATGISTNVTTSDYSNADFFKIPNWAKDEYVTTPAGLYPQMTELEYDAAWWNAQPKLPAPFDLNPQPEAAKISPRLNGFNEMERQRRKRLKRAGISPRTAEQIYAGLVLHSVIDDAMNV
jgi:hypothetical protein